MNISIIIPYWKREKQIELMFSSLAEQIPSGVEAEVLVCDSHSGGQIEEIIMRAQEVHPCLNIRHLQCENIVAQKRNVGIREARHDLLIFLDDDCVPQADYLKNVFLDVGNNPGVILCGEIRFPASLVGGSNYYRYRDSKHPTFSSRPFRELDQWSFVSMNMVAKKRDLIQAGLFYDERFIGYGCEDHEFPWRILKAGMKIRMGRFCIDHHEYDGDIVKYKRKIFCTARDGMYMLSCLAPEIVHSHRKLRMIETIYSVKGISTVLARTLFSILFNRYLCRAVELFLQKTDAKRNFYFSRAYRYVLLCNYLAGVRSREDRLTQASVGAGWYD
ncbi:glycosyltransferase [Janthinobacterium violaceinigrum]|uniref:Glycosyltransferase n=1 Tax=Janthinobacterium violaceinigrum TaxID=2654252 RepID=A0A6I1ICE0_9BURK|nr:glycosyltransferase [Janthinobacterium violaceinigrum]KAB8065996.1 glycosyltransferase [Janthinobacterium violaceinigrum]